MFNKWKNKYEIMCRAYDEMQDAYELELEIKERDIRDISYKLSRKVAEIVYLKKEIKKFNDEIKKLRGEK